MNNEQQRRYDLASKGLRKRQDLSEPELHFLLLLRRHLVLTDMTQETLARRISLGVSEDGVFQPQRISEALSGRDGPTPLEVVDAISDEFARKFSRPLDEVRAHLQSARVSAASAYVARRTQARLDGVANGTRALSAQEQAALVSDLANMRRQLAELQQTYQRLKAADAQRPQPDADLTRRAQTLQEEVVELKGELAASIRALQSEQQRTQALGDQLKTVEREREAREAELADLDAQHEQELAESRTYGAEQERGRLALRSEADQLLGEIESLRRRLTRAEALREGPRPESPDPGTTSAKEVPEAGGVPLVPGVEDEVIEELIDSLQRGHPPGLAARELEDKVVRHVESAVLPTGLLSPGSLSWTPGRSGSASSVGTLWVGPAWVAFLTVVFLLTFGGALGDSLPTSWAGVPAGVGVLVATLCLLSIPVVRRIRYARAVATLSSTVSVGLTLFLGLRGNFALAGLATLLVLAACTWMCIALMTVQAEENHLDEVGVFRDQEVYGPNPRLRDLAGKTLRFHRLQNPENPLTLTMVAGRLRVSSFRSPLYDFTVSRRPSILGATDRPCKRVVSSDGRVSLSRCLRLHIPTRGSGTASIERHLVWLWDEGELVCEGDPIALIYQHDHGESSSTTLFWFSTPVDGTIVRTPDREQKPGVRSDVFLAPLTSHNGKFIAQDLGKDARVQPRKGKASLDADVRKSAKGRVRTLNEK